jgi:hypothetical protein
LSIHGGLVTIADIYAEDPINCKQKYNLITKGIGLLVSGRVALHNLCIDSPRIQMKHDLQFVIKSMFGFVFLIFFKVIFI